MTQTPSIGGFSPWQANGRVPVSVARCALLAVGIVIAWLCPVVADTGDKQGWSVITDPRERAFLIYVPSAGGARLLNFACLRDVDNFTVYSEAVGGGLPSGPAILTVSNGSARYDVPGNIAPDPISHLPTFTGDIADDQKALSGISAKLLPVLQGSGPILYEIGAGAGPNDMSKSPTSIAIAGLAAPLAKFKSICFGQ